jgi:hypothetical protein
MSIIERARFGLLASLAAATIVATPAAAQQKLQGIPAAAAARQRSSGTHRPAIS